MTETADWLTKLQDEADRMERESDAQRNRSVRQVQDALTEEVAEAKGVPARLVALKARCMPLAENAIAVLSDKNFVNAHPVTRTMIESALSKARRVVWLLNHGGEEATRLVASINGLMHESVAPWVPSELIRGWRDKLRGAIGAPTTVENCSATLQTDLEEIGKRLRVERVESRGSYLAPQAPQAPYQVPVRD